MPTSPNSAMTHPAQPGSLTPALRRVSPGPASLPTVEPPAVAEPTVSELLGADLRVVRELGRGGMGRVLEAHDQRLDRRVALKTLLTESATAEARERFLLEARVTGQLEHPGIAPVYGLGRSADGCDYFTMRLVAGRSLQRLLSEWHAAGSPKATPAAVAQSAATRAEFPQSRLLSLFERVVETVGYAHSRGVLHRDLKPANIMVGEHGEVWVIDWGLAKAVGDAALIQGKSSDGEVDDPTVADLTVADPRQAELRQAELRQAELRQAELRQADPRQADPPSAAATVADSKTPFASLSESSSSHPAPATAEPGPSATPTPARTGTVSFTPTALTQAGATLGTPNYMAPEQARGEPLDVRADVFGLGGILYRVLTGQPPIGGATGGEVLARAARGGVRPVRQTRAGRVVPAGLAAIAEKCLAAERADRYADTAELLSDLRAWAADQPIRARPDTRLAAAGRWARHHRRGVAGAVMGVLILTAGVAAVASWLAWADRRMLEYERQAAQQREQLWKSDLEATRERDAARKARADRQRAAERRLRASEPFAEAADLLLRGQRYREATRLLSEAVTLDPDFVEGHYLLGESYRLRGLALDAAKAYQEADRLSRAHLGRPHTAALLAAGWSWDVAGDFRRSAQAFRDAEGDRPEHPLALCGRVWRLAQRLDYTHNVPAAEAALAVGPDYWETHLAVAMTLLDLVQVGGLPRQPTLDQVLLRLRHARELAPQQPEIWKWTSTALRQRDQPGDRAEAERLEALVLTAEAESPFAHRQAAVRRGLDGDWVAANSAIERAKSLGLPDWMYQQFHAWAAHTRGDLEVADAAFERLRTAHVDWPPNSVHRVELALRLARPEAAERWLAELNSSYPEMPLRHEFAATLARLRKQWPEALAAADAGLVVLPYSGNLHLERTAALLELSRWEEALPAAERAVELNPGKSVPLIYKTRALLNLNRLDEAQALTEKLRREKPSWRDNADRLLEAIRAAKQKQKSTTLPPAPKLPEPKPPEPKPPRAEAPRT